MALAFGALNTDDVDHGSDASLDNLDPFTCLLWIRETSVTNAARYWSKDGNNKTLLMLVGDDLQFQVKRATTDTLYITDSNPIVTGVWTFIACTFDSGASAGELINIYGGTLTALASEENYSTANDGSGAVNDDSGGSFTTGNQTSAATDAVTAEIAVLAYVDALLTLNQIRSWQFRPRVVANTKLFCHYGFNGTGTQADWSGNGNSGTVSGATVVDHVPLGPPFGFDLGWQGIVAAPATPASEIMAAIGRERQDVDRKPLEVVAY